jgi:hypothetical protein
MKKLLRFRVTAARGLGAGVPPSLILDEDGAITEQVPAP